MKSKKAWIAVIEAVLGILILFTFVMIVMSRNNANSQQDQAKNFQALFLNEIENNQDLRKNILASQITDVNYSLQDFLDKFNMNYNLDVCITDIEEGCSLIINSKEVTAYDYFVASNSTQFEPKKLKIFLWKEE